MTLMPKLYFSELLRKAIEDAESLFDHPFKQYALFKDFETKVEERQVEGIPERFRATNMPRHTLEF